MEADTSSAGWRRRGFIILISFLIKRCSLRAHYVTPGVAPSRQSAQFLPPKPGSLILRSLCTKQGWRNLGPKGTFIVSPQGWPLCIRVLNFCPQTRVFNSTLLMYQAGVVEPRVHLVPILCPPCSQPVPTLYNPLPTLCPPCAHPVPSLCPPCAHPVPTLCPTLCPPMFSIYCRPCQVLSIIPP